MRRHCNHTVEYLTFESLDEAGVLHGVFTRRGGVSPPPWDSLNLGGMLGDDSQRVTQNQQRMLAGIGLAQDSVYDAWQVHGNAVAHARCPRPLDEPHQKADAIISDTAGLTLLMRFADCVPILLYDPRRKAAGLVHAGWQGTVHRTVCAAVAAMQAAFDSRPADLLAAIGPSIGPDHYEVGGEVIAAMQQTFGERSDELLRPASESGKAFLDLWRANRILLEQAGVRQVETAGICTACHTQDWYSHRREAGKTGRFGALIALS
jgi:hypothetical protein